jgi:hypothetical protein
MNWTVGTSPYDVALGDFNLDGLADLAAANFGSDTVTVLLNNYIPTLNIYQPDGVGDRADTFYKIKWVGADVNLDEVLAIDLYYVNYTIIENTTHEIRTPIILGTNNDGIYTWNTTDVVEGNYSIYGEIKDDRGGIGSNYSIGNVSIYHNAHPDIVVLTPPIDGAVADSSFTIKWIDQDLDDDALINLYMDTDRIYNNGNEQVIIKGLSEDNEEDEYNWITVNETEDEFYILADIYDNWGVKNYNYSLGRLKIDHNVLNNSAPDITLLEPDGIDDKIDGSFFITWWDHDPDDNAEISLYYDNDNNDFNGLKIVDNLSEDSEINKFHWSTIDVPNGSYYIYAKIDDKINAPVFNYSSGQVNVSHKTQNIQPWISIIEPDGTDDSSDMDFEIKWTDSDPDDNAEILLYYNTEKGILDGINIVKGLEEDDEDNSYLWNTTEIPGGKYFIYAMIFDFVNEPFFNISAGQVLVDHNKSPASTNSPPTLEILEPDGKDDLANTSYLIQWIDDDPEDDAIITLFYDSDNIGFDGDIIINKLSEDGERDHYLWNTTKIQGGSYYIYGVISDSFNAPYYVYSIGNLTISHNLPEDETPVIIDVIVEAVISTPLSSKIYLTSDRIIFDGSQSTGVDLTYNWFSSIEGDIGHQTVFTKNLSAGEHRITLEVRDRNSQTSIAEIVVSVEEPSSKDRDHAPDLIASTAFILIFIITIIIFFILIRKRVEKPDLQKTKKARDTKNQKRATGSKSVKNVEMRKKRQKL